jgi:hypothetical protein
MSQSDPRSISSDTTAVSQLLDRRNQVQSWLARLDEMTTDTATHVATRVRADYENRLDSVLAELGTHLDGIRADVDRLRTRLDEAGLRYETAVDSLEETRLRYRIGELEERMWEERRVALEAEVATVAAARDEVAAELHRMEDIASQIEGSERPARPYVAPPPPPPVAFTPPPPPPPAPRVAAVEEEPLLAPFSPPVEESLGGPLPDYLDEAPAPPPLPFLGGRDFPWELPPVPPIAAPKLEPHAETGPPPADFLAELDRALNDDSKDDAGYTLTEAELDTRPKAGVKCADCGYTNDPQAWYCGVCGADLS